MYAVIKTGGKQYRVQPGDVLVVEKLDGEAGAEISFDQVLAMGEGGDVTLGAPLIEGAFVKATLIETRKGEKVKIFKKIRRQGYRRTKGHRQPESVLRVTSIGGKGGKTEKWDGEVDLTPRAVLNARARGFKDPVEAPAAEARPAKAAKPAAPKAAKAPKAADETKAPLVEQPISEVEAGAPETVAPKSAKTEPKPAKKAEAPKKAAAPKAEAKKAEAKTEAAPKAKAAPKAAKAKAEDKSEAAPAKKPAAKKAKPADGGKA